MRRLPTKCGRLRRRRRRGVSRKCGLVACFQPNLAPTGATAGGRLALAAPGVGGRSWLPCFVGCVVVAWRACVGGAVPMGLDGWIWAQAGQSHAAAALLRRRAALVAEARGGLVVLHFRLLAHELPSLVHGRVALGRPLPRLGYLLPFRLERGG